LKRLVKDKVFICLLILWCFLFVTESCRIHKKIFIVHTCV